MQKAHLFIGFFFHSLFWNCFGNEFGSVSEWGPLWLKDSYKCSESVACNFWFGVRTTFCHCVYYYCTYICMCILYLQVQHDEPGSQINVWKWTYGSWLIYLSITSSIMSLVKMTEHFRKICGMWPCESEGNSVAYRLYYLWNIL